MTTFTPVPVDLYRKHSKAVVVMSGNDIDGRRVESDAKQVAEQLAMHSQLTLAEAEDALIASSLTESDSPDEDPEAHKPDTSGICGAITNAGTPCQIEAGKCPHHSPSDEGTYEGIETVDQLREELDQMKKEDVVAAFGECSHDGCELGCTGRKSETCDWH